MFVPLLRKYVLMLFSCLSLIVAMAPLTAQAAGQNIVKYGGFENPVVSSGFTEYSAGQSFGGWTVGAGSIDLVKNDYWIPAQGSQSVDLDGSSAGTIYQDLPTVGGSSYSLSFFLAGNPVCGPAVVQMQIWWGTTLVDTLSFNTAHHSTAHMGWLNHGYTVQATGTVTRLSFVSLTGSLCGPTLDGVKVEAVNPGT